MIPGKEALSYLNNYLQDTLGLNITIPAIIDAMSSAEVPAEIQRLIENLAKFGALKPPQESPHLSDRSKNVGEEWLLPQHLGEALHQRAQPIITHCGQ